ncbi:M48 family metallopeptidase [Glaesserella sp.]|uniref:M48 family metallopeptidase n=1 Tax=Glaesserella sp. TaxID=2094731 RepID=UPI0035A19078
MKKFLLIVGLALGLSACVNTQDMNAKAESAYSQVKAEAAQKGWLDTTSKTARRIHKVFNTMKPYAERENTTGIPFNWEVIVLRSDDLNAWAMPGGKMGFSSGLIDRLSLSDDEIATVMGHEMVHALKEHSKISTNRSMVVDTLFGVTQAVLGDINVGGYSALGSLKTFGVDNPFSRSDESEADELGLYLMAKSGYNPQAASQLWTKMQKATGGSGGFFTTHPSDENRQENIQKWMPQAMQYYQARK